MFDADAFRHLPQRHPAGLRHEIVRGVFRTQPHFDRMAGAPLVVFDSSGQTPVAGAVTLSFKPASGMAAIFAMLPPAQRLMIAFADARVDNAGTPVRSTKITRSE